MADTLELRFELPLHEFTLRMDLALGDVTVVMGPSGAGKTSLLEAVAGLRGVRGRIAFRGRAFVDAASGVCLAPEARRVGYVPQHAGLFPHLDVLANLRFAKGGRARALDDAIQALDLGPLLARWPSSLSGGEQQRVALGRALASEPELLLLDEPLAALDLGARERVLPFLLEVRERFALPLIYVTHSPGEARALGGCVLALDRGTARSAASALELLATGAALGTAPLGLENLLPGHFVAHDEAAGVSRVALAAGGGVAVPLASERALGSRVTLSIRAEDVLVAAAEPIGLSARNVFPVTIESSIRAGADVLLSCVTQAPGPAWIVRLTPGAAVELQLVPGRRVFLAVKSHAVRVM